MKSIERLEGNRAGMLFTVFIRNLYFFIPVILDAVYLSKITTIGISGIGVIVPVLYLIKLFQRSFSHSTVLEAQKLNTGKGENREEIRALLCICFYYLFGISLLFMFSFPLLVRVLNSAFWKFDGDVKTVLLVYSRWISPRIFLTGAWLYINAFFRIHFEPEHATKIGLVTVIANVVFNTLCMFYLIDDPASAAKYLALATVLSTLISIILGIIYIFRHYRDYISVQFSYLRDLQLVKLRIKSMLTVLFESASSALAFNVYIVFLTKFGSDVMVAFSFVESMIGVCHSWNVSVAYWNQSYISQMIDYTKRSISREKYRYFLRSVLIFLAITFLISIALIAFYFLVLRYFVDHSAAVQRYILFFLLVDMLLQLGRLCNVTNVSFLLILNKYKRLLWNTVVIKYLFFLLLLYINDVFLGPRFVAIPVALFVLDEYLRGIANFRTCRRYVTVG